MLGFARGPVPALCQRTRWGCGRGVVVVVEFVVEFVFVSGEVESGVVVVVLGGRRRHRKRGSVQVIASEVYRVGVTASQRVVLVLGVRVRLGLVVLVVVPL